MTIFAEDNPSGQEGVDNRQGVAAGDEVLKLSRSKVSFLVSTSTVQIRDWITFQADILIFDVVFTILNTSGG